MPLAIGVGIHIDSCVRILVGVGVEEVRGQHQVSFSIIVILRPGLSWLGYLASWDLRDPTKPALGL